MYKNDTIACIENKSYINDRYNNKVTQRKYARKTSNIISLKVNICTYLSRYKSEFGLV